MLGWFRHVTTWISHGIHIFPSPPSFQVITEHQDEFPVLQLLCATYFAHGSVYMSCATLLVHPTSVQLLSHVWLFATPWTAAGQASLSITTPRVYPNSCPLSQWYHPSISSSVVTFSSRPLKSLLQHHNSKASILQCSAFFIVQLSDPYTTTGKSIALTRWTFVDTVMSLLFNMLSRLVITLLPRSKCFLIPWLQSPSTVILEPPKNKVSHCFPIYLPWSDGARCHDLPTFFLP